MGKTMAYAALFLFSFAGTASPVQAFQCNVCHSKNPAMVRMHKAVQAKEIGCFDCHKVGEELMRKGRPKEQDSLLTRRAADPVCVECHAKARENKQ